MNAFEDGFPYSLSDDAAPLTNQEILTKAIEKAIKGGWRSGDVKRITIQPYRDDSHGLEPTPIAVIDFTDGSGFVVVCDSNLIFNHDFAKALWDEKLILITYTVQDFDGDAQGRHLIKNWQYHLQQMVIADDPIKYLGEHL